MDTVARPRDFFFFFLLGAGTNSINQFVDFCTTSKGKYTQQGPDGLYKDKKEPSEIPADKQ